MLRLDDVVLRPGEFTLAADFAVAAGRFVAVIGPSGAGKSTLLAAIGGYLEPARGAILWDGRDLARLRPGERPISTIFQDQNLFPHLSVARNVALGVSAARRLPGDLAARADAALERVGLAGLGERRPSELSGGQQSRVALARLLLRRRAIALLDEPFAALGPGLRDEMLDLVRATLAGTTVLLVTHDPDDALRVADEVVVVAQGRAAAPIPASRLRDAPPATLRAYLGRGPD